MPNRSFWGAWSCTGAIAPSYIELPPTTQFQTSKSILLRPCQKAVTEADSKSSITTISTTGQHFQSTPIFVSSHSTCRTNCWFFWWASADVSTTRWSKNSWLCRRTPWGSWGIDLGWSRTRRRRSQNQGWIKSWKRSLLPWTFGHLWI